MKIIQTFWSGARTKDFKNTLSICAGWPSPEYHWMSWALSCLQAKEVFGEVELITDLQGKHVLTDLLDLPYSHVSTVLENSLEKYPSNLWSVAKIFSYSLQTEPFLHLDGDVFFWQKPGNEILQAEIIAQNLEENLFFYKDSLKEINEHFKYIPWFLKKNYSEIDIYASNAGIFGGHNIAFIKKYCTKAFEFIDQNLETLHKVNIPNLNFICEQHFLHQLAISEKIPIRYLIEEIVTDPAYKQFIRFEDVPFVNMIHTLGGFKNYLRVCNHISKKLRREYPNVYYKIISLLRNDRIGLMSKVYSLKPFTDEDFNNKNSVTELVVNKKNNFKRTIAAIEYVNQKKLFAVLIDKEKIINDDFPQIINEILPGSIEKDILLEVYNIELNNNRFFNSLYIEKQKCIRVYEEDKNQYDLIQKTFAYTKEEMFATFLCLHSTLVEIEVGWTWKYDTEEQISILIQKNFEAEKQNGVVLLLPLVLQLQVNEYYLDTLDMIIIECAREMKCLSELLQEVGKYFEEQDVNDNPESFTQLIIDSVKRLLYAGALKIIS